MIIGATPFLTCVDCLKDFRGDEFKEHTKCISEEEKYSAKGFVAKPNKNKGALKQESWTETLQNLSNKPGLDPQIKSIVQKLAAQTNVPRKKPKFINFIKNSLRISFDNANKVWDVIEEALEEFKQVTEAKNKEKKNTEKKEKENGGAESSETVDQNVENGKKKKKKNKNLKVAEDGTNGHNIEDKKSRKRAMDTGTDEGTAKKKKKKNKTNGTNVHEIEDESGTANGNSEEQEPNSFEVSPESKFNWQSTIVNILSKKTAPIAVDKLKSKVVKKYASQTLTELSPKVEKKFLKKLKSTPNVRITNEFVQLVK